MGRGEWLGHDEGVASVLFGEERQREGQTGRGENQNKQRDWEKLVSEIQAQICVNSKSLGAGGGGGLG